MTGIPPEQVWVDFLRGLTVERFTPPPPHTRRPPAVPRIPADVEGPRRLKALAAAAEEHDRYARHHTQDRKHAS